MRLARSTAAASWLVGSTTPFDRLVTLGPDGSERYARLRFIPDPDRPGQSESDVEVADDHPSDLDQARSALRVLGRFTGTPDRCWFCVWEGYSQVVLPPGWAERSAVTLPHRRYALFEGPLDAILTGERDLGSGTPPPAFVWPADRRWCFTSDVDPHWAGIGAEPAAVAALLAEPGLDVVAADPGRRQPTYY